MIHISLVRNVNNAVECTFAYFKYILMRVYSNSDDNKKCESQAKNTTRSFRLGSLPCEIAAYLAIHTFGIRMIYPGSVKLLQSYMSM